MLKCLLVVLILSKFVVINGQKFKFVDTICSTNGTQTNYFLDRTVVAKLRSPNFPVSLLNNTRLPECLAFFQTADTNYNIWFALYNGYSGSISITDGLPANTGYIFDSYSDIEYYTTSGQTLFFQQTAAVDQQKHWNAFEAVVLTYDPSKSSCPFASNDIEVISVPQDTVIPLTSSYISDGSIPEPTRCQWAFDFFGSSEYNSYLKLVLKGLSINDNVNFELFQGDQLIQSFQNNITVKEEPQVFYFYIGDSENSRFLLIWNDTSRYSWTYAYFNALVSMVIFPLEYPYFPCNATTYADTTNITWHNYEPNQGCNYNMVVPRDTEYYLTTYIDYGEDGDFEFLTEKFDLERNVDILSLSSSSDKIIIDRGTELRITPSNRFSPTDPVLSFFADGSIQQGGFHLTLQKLDCRCLTTKVVIVNDHKTYLAPVICNNQSCPIEISMNSSSPAFHFVIEVTAVLRQNLDFTQWTNKNGDFEKLTNASFQDDNPITRWFLKDDVVILEYNFGVGESNIQPHYSIQWHLTTSVGYIDNNSTVYIDLNSSYYFLDMFDIGLYGTFTICTPEKDTLELFVSMPYYDFPNMVIYDSDNLQNYMGPVTSIIAIQSPISSHSGCFTLMDSGSPTYSSNEFLLRLKNIQSNNCSSTNNVFTFERANSYFEIESTSNGPCELIIMNKLPGLVIDAVTTTSNDKIIFKSALNQNVFMEMNSNETLLYNKTLFYTGALSIVFPSSSKLRIWMSPWLSRQIQTFDGQKGVMASPSFSGLNRDLFFGLVDSPFYELESSANDQRMVVTFKVHLLHGNQKLSIDNGTVTTSLTANQVITVEGTSIKVFSPVSDNKNYTLDYFLMEYIVHYINLAQTTTPSSGTTATLTSMETTATFVDSTVMNPTSTINLEDTTPFSTQLVTSASTSTTSSEPITSTNFTDKSSTSRTEITTSPTVISSTNKADATICVLSYKTFLLFIIFTILSK